MINIDLPISKSIANRLLILQALNGDPLLEVSVATPRDVVLLRSLLTDLLERKNTQYVQNSSSSITLDVDNCGTAARFLTAYASLNNLGEVVITGCERMKHRPIRQLVDVLLSLGADIQYIESEGYLPIKIKGNDLCRTKAKLSNPRSTQFVSALLLQGIDVTTDSNSPYIELTRRCIDSYYEYKTSAVEADWSSAAFWYEWVAIHTPKQPLRLQGLYSDSLQGDKAVADIFAQLGVCTVFDEEGAEILYNGNYKDKISVDFKDVPDLYPAVAVTCYMLGVELEATGTERLKWKESDREVAVKSIISGCVSSYGDHRIAMSLLAADKMPDDINCIDKSYPLFVSQLQEVNNLLLPSVSVVVARRNVNDEGRGKKFALHKLIGASTTDYIWLQDDDIIKPSVSMQQVRQTIARFGNPDLLILPLRMTEGSGTLIEKLQRAEYAAIQQLTILSARRGKAVMCSGANMIVSRNKWMECYGELHQELPSGDDMFLLEAFKRRGYVIKVIDDVEYEAWVKPAEDVKSLFIQRMRWAGKSSRYTDGDIISIGIVVLIANLLQLLCPFVIIIKFPFEYMLIKKRENSVSLFVILLLELVYPFYMFVCLIGGLLQSRKFKPQF